MRAILSSTTKAANTKMRVLLQKHVEPAVTRNSARPGAEISPLWTLGSTRTPQRTRQREVPTSSRAERAVFVLLLTIIGAAAVPIGSIDPWWSGIFEAVIFLIGACALIATIGKSWELPLVLAPFGRKSVAPLNATSRLGRGFRRRDWPPCAR